MKKSIDFSQILSLLKQGVIDIKLVIQEGKYKLFVKQGVVLLVLFLICHYVQGAFEQQKEKITGQIEAVHAQQSNEQTYLSNKKKLLDLEPRFPSMDEKNDWLLRQVVSIFKDAKATPSLGAQSESTGNGYTIVSVPVNLSISYGDFGRLLASIESRDEFLRVSGFSIEKQPTTMGVNAVNMQINTIFPKEKIASSVFKDNVTEVTK